LITKRFGISSKPWVESLARMINRYFQQDIP
jgi:hypothetical protein